VLASRGSTQNALVSQIELCDILLEQIGAVRCKLEERNSSSGATARRKRNTPHRPVLRRGPRNRLKRRK
jgi:hypothetical protein